MTIGGLQLSAGDHLVEGEPQPVAVARGRPSRCAWQSLKLDFLTGQVEPVMQVSVVRA